MVICEHPVTEARLTTFSRMATEKEARLELWTASADLLRNVDGYEIIHVACVDLPPRRSVMSLLHFCTRCEEQTSQFEACKTYTKVSAIASAGLH
jgi:hypothetical protein